MEEQETTLEMAERHVHEMTARVARQRELLVPLHRDFDRLSRLLRCI